MLTFTFDTLDRLEKKSARRQVQDGVLCRVDKLTLARDRWTVRVALEMPEGGKKLESFQATSWVVNNEMVLVSKDGKKRLRSSSYVVESCSSRRAVLSYNFLDQKRLKRGRPGDWKLTYRTPALIVDVPISFRFENIPLP
jgi:hypothetical protein